MLRSLNDLERYKVEATDGDLGTVVDFLLDDDQWVVRYLIVEVSFLSARRVLVSPISFRNAEWSTRHFHLALTKDRIKNSPSVDTEKPVSRQHEADYNRYYAYGPYWGRGTGPWGLGPYPTELRSEIDTGPRVAGPETGGGDVHLRSARQVCGYEVEGNDGAIGHIGDFIVDDDTWAVRYLRVNTGSWWFSKKVLVAPHWARRVSWAERKVFVDLTRERIKSSPEWTAEAPINREYEVRLYDYYGRPVYWSNDGIPSSTPAAHSPPSSPKATRPEGGPR